MNMPVKKMEAEGIAPSAVAAAPVVAMMPKRPPLGETYVRMAKETAVVASAKQLQKNILARSKAVRLPSSWKLQPHKRVQARRSYYVTLALGCQGRSGSAEGVWRRRE